jgi:hypothetical protein
MRAKFCLSRVARAEQEIMIREANCEEKEEVREDYLDLF